MATQNAGPEVVVVGVGVSEAGERAARFAARIARSADTTLVAAYVNGGVKAEGLVRHGHPAETLCDIGHERGATHLLVGRRGQSRVRDLLFGSTPGNLIQFATVPVTVVP